MLNNFCFHVYAQKCLWLFAMLSCHDVICQVLMLITRTGWTIFVFMSMLKSHCLWLFVMSCCQMLITGTNWSTFAFMSMIKSHCLWLFVMLSCCHMSKASCWSLGHAEQLLFSCVCSKVIVCHAVMSSFHDVIMSCCHMSYVKCLMLILGTCLATFVFMSRLKT